MEDMNRITVKDNQSVFYIALEQYGTVEAVGEIIADNPALTNDPATLTDMGIEARGSSDFYIAVKLEPGQHVLINPESKLMKSGVTKLLTMDITTFNL